MNTLLICPSSRPTVDALAKYAPLAALPFLGESLAEYWLTHLALNGTKEVSLLVNDRPEQILAIVGNGSRWGLNAEIIVESRELTPAQAEIKYAKELTGPVNEVVTLDHFPGSQQSLFTSYSDLYAGLVEWLPKAKTVDRVGVRELSPGIWVGRNSRIAKEAKLHAPCWIGQSAFIGAHAVVGPMAIIEDRAFLEPGAEVSASVVGSDTFIGQFATIENSFACGDTLVNWKSGVTMQVSDAFLMCALRRPAIAKQSESFLSHLRELYSRYKEDLQMVWKHFLMDKEG
jgi:NDP-sugar pyrophosphorylase family protein